MALFVIAGCAYASAEAVATNLNIRPSLVVARCMNVGSKEWVDWLCFEHVTLVESELKRDMYHGVPISVYSGDYANIADASAKLNESMSDILKLAFRHDSEYNSGYHLDVAYAPAETAALDDQLTKL